MPCRTCAPAGETDEQLARRLQAEYDAQPAASPARPAAAAPAQQPSPAGPLESGAAVRSIFPACAPGRLSARRRALCRTCHIYPKAPQWPLLCGTPGFCQEMFVYCSPRASSALQVPPNGYLQHAAGVHSCTGAGRPADSERTYQDLARERLAALCAGALPDG